MPDNRSDNRSDNIYGFLIRNIMHRTKQILDESLVPYDITNQQARIVGHIGACQENGHDICQKDIEMAMKIKGSSITSLLQGLERKGFILRSTGVADGRTKELSLTPKGQALTNKFKEIFAETETRMMQGMTEEQKKTFLQILQMITHNLES